MSELDQFLSESNNFCTVSSVLCHKFYQYLLELISPTGLNLFEENEFEIFYRQQKDQNFLILKNNTVN